MAGKHSQARYQNLSSYFPKIWFWILCSTIVVHTALLLITGLHSPYTPLIQMLRPLVTCGAVILLLQPSYMQSSTQRWSKICLAIGMICSALFSALKINLDASIAMVEMRLLWVLINFFYILGTALYLRKRLLRPGNAFLVFHGSITVGIATLIILHSTLPRLMLWPWNAQVAAQLPSLSFDIGGLFIYTFLRMRFGKNLSFFLLIAYYGCLIFAEVILTVIVWAGWNQFEGVAAPTYPLYALQSVLFAFAIYRDSCYRGPELDRDKRVLWEDVFIWAVVVLAFSALFISNVSQNVPYWLLSALYVSAILYVVLCLKEYWRIMNNSYLASLARLKATIGPTQPPED